MITDDRSLAAYFEDVAQRRAARLAGAAARMTSTTTAAESATAELAQQLQTAVADAERAGQPVGDRPPGVWSTQRHDPEEGFLQSLNELDEDPDGPVDGRWPR